MSKAAQKKEQREWAKEIPKLDNARRLRGICFIDPEDGEREKKEAIKTARKKLEILMEAAMPCKTGSKKGLKKLWETASETDESNKIPKTKHACIVKAHESTRKRLDSILPKDHEDHIAGKGYKSISQYNLVHKFLPMPQAMKIPDAKAVSAQGMGEARKVACVAIEQGEEQKKRSFWKHKKSIEQSFLPH